MLTGSQNCTYDVASCNLHKVPLALCDVAPVDPCTFVGEAQPLWAGNYYLVWGLYRDEGETARERGDWS